MYTTEKLWHLVVTSGFLIVIAAGTSDLFGVVDAGTNGNTTAASLLAALGSDPGFANVGVSSTGGAGFTYLGNGWCITANHVTISNSFPRLAINGQSFQVTQVINAPFGGADLKLFQINGDPGLPALTIATSAPATSAPVVMIGNGPSSTGQQTWNVTVPNAPGTSPKNTPWVWSSPAGSPVNPLVSNSSYWSTGVASPGSYQAAGLGLDSVNVIRWGQNQITQTNFTDGATKVFYMTFNDSTYSPGAVAAIPANEAQMSAGDSGGIVFNQTTGQLIGIMIDEGLFQNQPSPTVAFGDITVGVDLSQYRNLITPLVNPFTWTGQTLGVGLADSNWNTTSTNWAGGTNSITLNPNPTTLAGAYRDGTSVVFGDQNAANSNSTITTTAVTIQAAGVAPASVTFNNSAVNYTLSDASGSMGISGSTGITKLGTASVTLSSPNSFSGPVYINAGRINLQNSSAFGTSSGVTVDSGAALELQNNIAIGAIPLAISGAGLSSNPAGALDNVSGSNTYAGAIALSGIGATINSATAGATLTLSGGITTTGSSLAFTGAGNTTESATITGTSSLAKSGSGTLTLSGTHTYTGGTTITGGVLSVNGTLDTETNGVNVNAGGTLKGTGVINRPVVVALGGQLAPGNSVGTLTVSALSLAGGAILDYEFNSIPANDFTDVTTANGLTINGGGFNIYQEGTTTPFGIPGTYHLLNYVGSLQGSGVSAMSVLDPLAGLDYSFTDNSSLHDVDLTITAVPEPSGVTLIAVGGLAIAGLAFASRSRVAASWSGSRA